MSMWERLVRGHVAGIVEEPQKLGPPSRGTRTKSKSGRVRIHKDFPLAEVLHLPPISPLRPREGLRHSHCRTWIFPAVSQTGLPVPKAERGRKTVCEKEAWRQPEERALNLSGGHKPHL